MQYHLYHYRRLRRNSIGTAISYNNSKCKYYLCDRNKSVMYWRNRNLFGKRSCAQRRHRSLEQQQSGSCNSKCSRIGDRNISRNLQYYLYNYRRLRRNSIGTAVSYNKSKCKYHLSDRKQSVMYQWNGNLYCQWSCPQRRYRIMEQQQHGCCHCRCSRIGNRSIGRYLQYHLHHYRRLRWSS